MSKHTRQKILVTCLKDLRCNRLIISLTEMSPGGPGGPGGPGIPLYPLPVPKGSVVGKLYKSVKNLLVFPTIQA